MRKVKGSYQTMIWREHAKVTELAAGGLLKLGLKKGEMLGIMCQTRAEWTWADLAILSCAGVTVPVYPTLTGPEANYILNNSDCVGVIAENAAQLEKILAAPNLPKKLRFAICIDSVPDKKTDLLKVIAWEDLLKDGEVYLPLHPKELQERMDSIKPSELATLVYTSGTTGIPKGVMLLHSNIYSICKSMEE